MHRMRNIVLGISVLLAVVILVFYMDYADLSWSANRSNYIALLSVSCIASAMLGSNHHDRKAERRINQGRIDNDTRNE